MNNMIGNKLEYLLEYQRHNLILTKTLEHLSTERASNESLLIALKETPLAMTSKHHYYKQLSKLDAGRYNPDEPHIRMLCSLDDIVIHYIYKKHMHKDLNHDII